MGRENVQSAFQVEGLFFFTKHGWHSCVDWFHQGICLGGSARQNPGGPERLPAKDLKIEAELIALIYRYRWQIRLFYKWMKSILGRRSVARWRNLPMAWPSSYTLRSSLR